MPEPIEIVIRKTQETTTQEPSAKSKSSSSKGKESTTQKAINTALVNAGKQFARYGISQYGEITGNTIAQRSIDNAVQVAGYVGQIVAGGWVGAIAVATQLTMGAISRTTANAKANQQATLLYERSGNISIDGGRGTYE